MRLRIRLYRFRKLGNVTGIILHGVVLVLEELLLDKIIAWLRMEAGWVDNIAVIIILLSLVAFVLWVLLHDDKETTAKQLYLTIQAIKKREQDLVNEVLPFIQAQNKQIAFNRNYLDTIKSELDNLYSQQDIENMEGQQAGNLITGNTYLQDVKINDKKLRSLLNQLSVLRSEVMSLELETILNRYFRVRQGHENVTVGFRVLDKCFILDPDFIGRMTRIIRRGNIKVQGLEQQVVETLSEYAGRPITQSGKVGTRWRIM
ncbi:MAG: hypothetical protein Q8Q07_07920 [Dehalococcoidales bacterium]|nr:hypothetical protein [Dehalococcoidales bacterium]